MTSASTTGATDTRDTADGVFAVVVLGMHRSGTSCLTGSLSQCGLHLGKVYESAPHNRKGNRESKRIMELNNAVLGYSNGAWDRPPKRLAWNPVHERERDDIIRELREGAQNAWGFKDPRAVLTLPFWCEGLQAVRFVGTYRHPAQVARSLHARATMPLPQGLELWRIYNQRLLEYQAEHLFPLVCFDLPEANYTTAIYRVAAELGLTSDRPTEDGRFFEGSLRHVMTGEEGIEVPAALLKLYDQLNSASELQCT